MTDEKSTQRSARRVEQLNQIAQNQGFSTWTKLETAVMGGSKIEVEQFPRFADATRSKLYNRHCTAREFVFAFCTEYYRMTVADAWTTGDHGEFREWCKQYEIDHDVATDLIKRMGDPELTHKISEVGNLDADHLGYDLTAYLFADLVIAVDTENSAFFIRPESADMPTVKNFVDSNPNN